MYAVRHREQAVTNTQLYTMCQTHNRLLARPLRANADSANVDRTTVCKDSQTSKAPCAKTANANAAKTTVSKTAMCPRGEYDYVTAVQVCSALFHMRFTPQSDPYVSTMLVTTYPSSWFSKDMVALSVSMSASTLPALTSSPSFTYHLAMLP